MDGNQKSNKLTVGKILKYLVILVILAVYGIFMFRICTMDDPAAMEKYVWTESMVTLYKRAPDEFKVKKVNEDTLSYQYITPDGKFAVNSIFITETGGGKAQVQFTLRYNNSTVKYLKEDYGLTDDIIGEPFVYTLSDSYGNIYRNYHYTTDAKTVYTYRHIIFEDVDITGFTDIENSYGLFLDIHYIENVKLADIPYGSLPLFKCQHDIDGRYVGYVLDPYNIKKDLFKKDSPTPNIMVNPAYLVKD